MLAGNPLDLSIYIIIDKTCADLRPKKRMIGPLGPPEIISSIWLLKIPFAYRQKVSYFPPFTIHGRWW